MTQTRTKNLEAFSAGISGVYAGTITTTGKSEAIRLEKALFRSHPEFRQKSKVQAHVIGRGMMLVSVADDATIDKEVDPVMAAFLSFLDQDITNVPAHIERLDKTRIAEARELTKNIVVRDDELLPDDVSL